MFTKKLEDQFSADLLNTVKGILDEAKKKCKDCGCDKCECEDEKEEMDEEKRGLWDNIHAKRKRIKAGSGERMRKPGSKGAPTDADFKAASESVEIEEGITSMSDARLKFHATKDFPHGSYTKKEIKDEHERRRRTVANYHTVKPSLSEDIEQIDELSKATLGRYVKKSAERMSTQGVVAGLKIAKDEKSQNNFDTISKRSRGISTAVKKLTKEDQDFIDSLNKELFDEIDIAEGRGRPPKEGTPAWHARQKQANDDMVALGMQLRKAKSMNKKVRFMDGKEHEVSTHHADKFEDHMAARKTSQEKAAFQKQAHKSHADFVKAVSAPVPKASKDTGEIVKYRH